MKPEQTIKLLTMSELKEMLKPSKFWEKLWSQPYKIWLTMEELLSWKNQKVKFNMPCPESLKETCFKPSLKSPLNSMKLRSDKSSWNSKKFLTQSLQANNKTTKMKSEPELNSKPWLLKSKDSENTKEENFQKPELNCNKLLKSSNLNNPKEIIWLTTFNKPATLEMPLLSLETTLSDNMKVKSTTKLLLLNLWELL